MIEETRKTKLNLLMLKNRFAKYNNQLQTYNMITFMNMRSLDKKRQ